MKVIERLKSFIENFNWMDNHYFENNKLNSIFDEAFIRLIDMNTGFDLRKDYEIEIDDDRNIQMLTQAVIIRNKWLSNDIVDGYQITILFKRYSPGFFITLNLGHDLNEKQSSYEALKKISNYWKTKFHLPDTCINFKEESKDNVHFDKFCNSLITSSEFTLENLCEKHFTNELGKMLMLLEQIKINTAGNWTTVNRQIISDRYVPDLAIQYVQCTNVETVVDQIVTRKFHDKNVTKHHTLNETLEIIEKYKNALINGSVKKIECLIDHGVIASIEFFDGEQILTRRFVDIHTNVRKVILNDFEKRFCKKELSIDSIRALMYYIDHINCEFGL